MSAEGIRLGRVEVFRHSLGDTEAVWDAWVSQLVAFGLEPDEHPIHEEISCTTGCIEQHYIVRPLGEAIGLGMAYDEYVIHIQSRACLWAQQQGLVPS